MVKRRDKHDDYNAPSLEVKTTIFEGTGEVTVTFELGDNVNNDVYLDVVLSTHGPNVSLQGCLRVQWPGFLSTWLAASGLREPAKIWRDFAFRRRA